MTDDVLLLTGMAPDARIFDRILPAMPAATVVSWIDPLPQESIQSYAARLADTIELSNLALVCGVSFGGIVARELAHRLDARACVLISSVRSPGELPPWFRAMRPFAGHQTERILHLTGRMALGVPHRVRRGSTVRLSKFAGKNGAWLRWASSSVLRWRPSDHVERVPTVQIHGSRDTTFPMRYVRPDYVVAGGGHNIAWTHADEVLRAIRRVAT